MTAPAVRIRDLRYRYRGGERDILRIGALDVDGPGLLAVTGPTGVGKTTLMELLAGTLREPYQGSVRVLGVELRDLRRDRDRQCHLRRIGLIPQDFGLLAGCTAGEILHRDLADAQVPLSEHAARVRRALEQVGLLAFAGRMSEQLSGGQRQRVAIARTLARDVELIIADEPTANLDPTQADSIVALFERLSAGRPVVVVTHDPRVAARCARRLELRPLVEAVSAAAAVSPSAAAGHGGPRGAAALAGALVLAVAVAGSTLAVRATNAHRTSRGGAAVALRVPAAATRPGPSAAGAPSRQVAPVGGIPPRGSVSTPGPGGVITRIIPVVQVVDRTPPGPQPGDPSSPQPPTGVSPPTAPPLPSAPAPAPPTAPPVPAPPAPAPSFAIAGHSYPVCSGGACSSSFMPDADWSPNVPSYADADGSILGNAHGLPTGLEVDYWNGTSLVRLRVLASTTVLNWGRPAPTEPPPGTVMQLGGVDQANACMDPTCAAPYYYTYVFLGAATSAAG
ncbi:MAG: ATP-binding cassette domain-containing protein [Chloroflexi bacterium]|nr:MAG: ATP-binding cassette domain-containing protein [Chloroflexota bacterium]